MDHLLLTYFFVAAALLFQTDSSLAQTTSFLSSNDCPRSCQCFIDPNSNDFVTQCVGSELASIPENIPSETTALDVSNSAVIYLRPRDLSHFNRMRHISLTFNRHFSVIEEGTFGNSSNLKKIEIYGNNLQNLDERSMRGCDDVTELNIHSNPELQLSRGFLTLFWSLEMLHVANTPFQYNVDLFLNVSSGNNEDLDKLIYLNIESKQIRSLGESVLQHTPNIKLIRIGHNYIAGVDESMFSKNPMLEEIYLDWNRVTDIHVSAFSNQPNLRYLDLTGNHLVTITMGTFDLMPPLAGVCLSWNPLSCDCNAQWLSKWITQFGRTNCMPYSFTQCSGEYQPMGQVLTEVSEEAFCDEESTTKIPPILLGGLIVILVIILISVVAFFIIVGLYFSGVRRKPGRPPISTIQLRRMNSNSTSALL